MEGGGEVELAHDLLNEGGGLEGGVAREADRARIRRTIRDSYVKFLTNGSYMDMRKEEMGGRWEEMEEKGKEPLREAAPKSA